MSLIETDSPTQEELETPSVGHQDVIRMWLRMLACTTLVETEIRRQFRTKFDFTLPRFDVLAQLDRRPEGMVLGELSKRLMVSAGNVTPLIERLIDDGLVTRTPSELDRRIQIVNLTPEGRKRFRRMAKWNGQLLASIFEQVTPVQIEELNALLKDVKEAVLTSTEVVVAEVPQRKRAKANADGWSSLHNEI